MIKGKTIQGANFTINHQYKNVKFGASCVKKNPLKTINLEVRFWMERSKDKNIEAEINNMFRQTKRIVHFEGGGWYDTDKTIAIKDVPDKLDTNTPKVFCLFDITLFPTIKFENMLHTSMELTALTDKIFDGVFSTRNDVLKSKN